MSGSIGCAKTLVVLVSKLVKTVNMTAVKGYLKTLFATFSSSD